MQLAEIIFTGDIDRLRDALRISPTLANEFIPLPDNEAKAHPLHRLCDAVFTGMFDESRAVKMANLFLDHGSSLNTSATGEDSPLTAACSLRCDKLASLYISRGANILHAGCHGGTALHWASWCGRNGIVELLIKSAAPINTLCFDFKSTPLFWSVHGLKFGGKENKFNQEICAELLINAGADPAIPNFEGYKPIDLLDKNDKALYELLSKN